MKALAIIAIGLACAGCASAGQRASADQRPSADQRASADARRNAAAMGQMIARGERHRCTAGRETCDDDKMHPDGDRCDL